MNLPFQTINQEIFEYFLVAPLYQTNTPPSIRKTKRRGNPPPLSISYASIVEIVSVVSSSTSSNALTVSNEVNIVTLYSVAV